MQPRSLVALYHAVGRSDLTGYRDAVAGESLERQLAWLKRRYRVLPLAELLERRRQGRALDGLAALTFDDNHRTVLDQALPLAAALDLPATWFLIGAPLAGRPFWRDLARRVEAAGQVEAFLAFAAARGAEVGRLRPGRFYRDSKDPARVPGELLPPLLEAFLPGAGPPDDFIAATELARLPRGVTLASHSARHLVLAGLPAATQRAEIAGGLAALQAVAPGASRALALPFGGPGSYDATTLAVAADLALAGLLFTAAEPVAADDMGQHPLAAAARLPLLVRDLPGRWPAERFA
jgi:peptidoglycan/xylan/chitin deacetylase (PgdA/CDA1 family)